MRCVEVHSSSAPNCKCFALEIIPFAASFPFVFTFMFAAAKTWHHGEAVYSRRILMPRVLVSVSVTVEDLPPPSPFSLLPARSFCVS